MTHFHFDVLGRELARHWGINGNNIAEVVESLNDDTAARCVLCAILESLRDVSHDIRYLKSKAVLASSAPKKHPISDGYMRVLSVSRGDREIPDDLSKLSSRARHTIYRGNFRMMSEVTTDKLLAIPQCGGATAGEIMQWKDAILNGVADAHK